MENLYDSEDEQKIQKKEKHELKISSEVISCDRKKIFNGTIKYNKEQNSCLIKDIKKDEIKFHQRLFYKSEKDDYIGYIEVFQNSSLSYSHQLSENISFLFESDSKDKERIDNSKCIGFRYYDMNNNYCTLLKLNDQEDDNYYFLEKLKENDNEFYDETLDCFKIIFESIFSRYKKNENKNNIFDFQLVVERPLYEILGFSYSILFKNTDKFRFHKIHSVNVMKDKDFTSEIPKENDKTKLNIMPILFDGHISLLFFVDQNDKRYYILSDPSHVHSSPFGKYSSINPFIFPKNTIKYLSVFPKKKIQAFNSCSLWYYFQILCLINYNEKIQNRKYSEAKDFVSSLKNSSFYFDCFNYYQYIMGFHKRLIEINPEKVFDDEDYFYVLPNNDILTDKIKIHKLCFLNQFVDFIEMIELITFINLSFKPGIKELNEFRKYNEELIDFLIYLNYNINFFKLKEADNSILKRIQNGINEIIGIRNEFIESCIDFLTKLAQIDISVKYLASYTSEKATEYKMKGKYLYEIYSEIKDNIELFHQKKNIMKEEFNLYKTDITGKILVPLIGFLYKSK